MRISYVAGIVLITVGGACRDQSRGGDRSSPTAGGASSRSIVGRWALNSLVINGEDWKARAGAIAYDTLDRDGTFRITRGDSVLEAGTWSQDTTVSPMIFDHNADHAGNPGHACSASLRSPGTPSLSPSRGQIRRDGARPSSIPRWPTAHGCSSIIALRSSVA